VRSKWLKRRQLGQSSELRVESPVVKKRVSCKSAFLKRRLYVCCSYREIVMLTVLKSIARIRLVESEKTKRVSVIYKLWKSAIVL
jgi:hypothetical protein